MQDSHRTLFTSPAEFVDSDHPSIIAEAKLLTSGISDPLEQARILYDAVRDGIRYDPYGDYLNPGTYRASAVLEAGTGYCVGKAALYAAFCRVVGIPARVGLADVRNHLATPRLLAAVGTDVFAYHGYTEVYLGETWLKASPTFNETLCDRLGVAPLPFDGKADALLQSFDSQGRTFMAYLADHGAYFDVPVKFLIREMSRLYPKLCIPGGMRGSMEKEAMH
ncbi:transglutaminase-like domain-containing protein [Bosea sp. BK604]|uniref:transglutaminase-like domain-containing protein n=1 Tax=Bosea sp. BK604 TaxID=2512180 RepID=UPI001053254C|nr:transglutaminase-like domain-containing protein [Bosea sp. BK604]TCR64550.1 transglutaminase superfamily protein [Bosea sp. BK604]